MKSKIAIFVAIVLTISMFAVFSDRNNLKVFGQKSIDTVAQNIENNSNVEKKSIGYEVNKKIYENKSNNTKISYPQISGYKGELLMDYMNQSLKRIIDGYGEQETYKDINIDYRITKMDEDILSVLFKGTGKLTAGKDINIEQSVNLQVKTANVIEFNNLINNNQASADAVRALIKQKAKIMGQENGVEFDGIRLYFDGDNVVFYFMPADDRATSFVEIPVPEKELKSHLNTDNGKMPAS